MQEVRRRGEMEPRGFCKKHGKLDELDIRKSDDKCAKCHRESVQRVKDKDPEGFRVRRAAKELADRMANPDKWAEEYKVQYAKSKAKYGLEGKSLENVIRMRGLTRDKYDEMLKIQNGNCKICCSPETRADGRNPGKVMRLVVDHCHKTKAVRGLLCHKCNVVLGMANESVETLIMAILYLEQSKEML